MVRTFCWILAICSLCVILFFRPVVAGASDRDSTAQHVAWNFSSQVAPVSTNRVIDWTFTELEKPDTPLPKTYAEARERALRTGLPLVVWVGEAVCPACVQRSKEEYVHWVTQSFPDTPKDALVVGLKVGDDLMRIGTMSSWPQPDGHLGTVAKALDLWRTHRQTTDQRGASYRGGQTAQHPVQFFQPQFYAAPSYGGYNSPSRGYAPAFRTGRGRSGGCST